MKVVVDSCRSFYSFTPCDQQTRRLLRRLFPAASGYSQRFGDIVVEPRYLSVVAKALTKHNVAMARVDDDAPIVYTGGMFVLADEPLIAVAKLARAS